MSFELTFIGYHLSISKYIYNFFVRYLLGSHKMRLGGENAMYSFFGTPNHISGGPGGVGEPLAIGTPRPLRINWHLIENPYKSMG